MSFIDDMMIGKMLIGSTDRMRAFEHHHLTGARR